MGVTSQAMAERLQPGEVTPCDISVGDPDTACVIVLIGKHERHWYQGQGNGANCCPDLGQLQLNEQGSTSMPPYAVLQAL